MVPWGPDSYARVIIDTFILEIFRIKEENCTKKHEGPQLWASGPGPMVHWAPGPGPIVHWAPDFHSLGDVSLGKGLMGC